MWPSPSTSRHRRTARHKTGPRRCLNPGQARPRAVRRPGGIVEEGESPTRACQREIAEEVGLEIRLGPLLVTGWVPAQVVWSDRLFLVFYGGVLARVVRSRVQRADLVAEKRGDADGLVGSL